MPYMSFAVVHFSLTVVRVVMVAGTTNLETHICMKALVTVSAEPSVIGIASGHRVNRSMQVRR